MTGRKDNVRYETAPALRDAAPGLGSRYLSASAIVPGPRDTSLRATTDRANNANSRLGREGKL